MSRCMLTHGPPKFFLTLSKEIPPSTFVASEPAKVEGYRYLPAVTWIGPGSRRYFHILGMDASFVQESWRSIVQSDWGNKIPKVLKISGKSRNSQSQGATLWLLMWNMCQNQVLSALSSADKWDSGGSTTPLTVVKIRIKTKQNKKTLSLHPFISAKWKATPEFSAAKEMKDAVVLTLGGGFFPPFCCAILGRDFRHSRRRGLLGTELRLLPRAAEPNPPLVQLHQSSQPHRRD